MVDAPPNVPVTLQAPSPPPSYRQYLRKVGLVIYNNLAGVQGPTQSGVPLESTNASGVDVSNMRITFQVRQFDYNVPNLATIRVYNLSDETALKIQKEFQYVALQAGYEGGNYGQIFQGTIKQFKKGRLDNITTYLEMFCSDGDQAWNFTPANVSIAAGASFQSQLNTYQGLINNYLTTPQQATLPQGLGGLTTPRGRVKFGLAISGMNDIALSTNTTFKIVNGQLIFTTMTGYDPGAAIQLNVRTGLVLVPEATDNGIEVVALLNPALRCGRRVQINNKDINTNTLTSAGAGVQPTILAFPASVAADGFYRVIVADHEGDSRGGPAWFTRMTCLALTSEDGVVATGG